MYRSNIQAICSNAGMYNGFMEVNLYIKTIYCKESYKMCEKIKAKLIEFVFKVEKVPCYSQFYAWVMQKVIGTSDCLYIDNTS